MEIRTSDFHFFLKSISRPFQSVAIFNSDFKCLHTKTSCSSNSVGLMSGLKALKNFFPWSESLVVAHNDSLLGCGGSNRIQFLFSVESFHFAIEEVFNLPWDFSQKVIKIPPVPIVENRRINIQLLENLTSQPDCPKEVNSLITKTIQKIELFQLDFKRLLKANKNFSSKELQKYFLSSSAQSALKSIKSKAYSSSQTEYEFAPLSNLKIKASTSELGIRIDFQGTTSHNLIQMSDSTTDSICFYFFADYFQFSDMMNDATFALFQIAKPTQSFINSKNISNKLYSDYCGPDLINQALMACVVDRSSLKPYMIAKPHFQLQNLNRTRQFAIPNAKPVGSMAVTNGFEILLNSRPTPGAESIPDYTEFADLGLEVKLCQLEFPSSKAKEVNDYQNHLQFSCINPVTFAFINPSFPAKLKLGKNKINFIAPTLSINGRRLTDPFATLNINPGDIIDIKTGYIEQ